MSPKLQLQELGEGILTWGKPIFVQSVNYVLKDGFPLLLSLWTSLECQEPVATTKWLPWGKENPKMAAMKAGNNHHMLEESIKYWKVPSQVSSYKRDSCLWLGAPCRHKGDALPCEAEKNQGWFFPLWKKQVVARKQPSQKWNKADKYVQPSKTSHTVFLWYNLLWNYFLLFC